MKRRLIASLIALIMVLSAVPAVYAAGQVLISVGVTPGGDMAVNCSSSRYCSVGETVTVQTWCSTSGYTFEYWFDGDTGDKLGYDTTLTFTVTGNQTVVASWRRDGYYFIASPDFATSPTDHTDGTISIDPVRDYYNVGDTVTLSNHANSGYRFVRYEIGRDTGGSSDDAIYTPIDGNSFQMPAYDIWLKGVFYSTAPRTITLNYDSLQGTATLSPQKDHYCEGDEVTLTVTPNEHYYVESLTSNLSQSRILEMSGDANTQSVLRFVMPDEDIEITPAFGEIPTVGVQLIPYPNDSGTFETDMNTSTHILTVTAVPNDGYEFRFWFFADDTSTHYDDPTLSFELTHECTLYAVFEYAAGHRIYQNNVKNGTFTYSPIGVTGFAPGSRITINASPDDGYGILFYYIAEVVGNSAQNMVMLDTNVFEMPDYDTLIGVQFAKEYQLDLSASPADAGTVSGGGIVLDTNGAQVTAQPNSGYRFVNWTEGGNVVSTNASYTFRVSGDRELVANFELIPPSYGIEISALPGEGGTVTGGGTFEQGANITVTAAANEGYRFLNWTEDDVEVSTDADYTFEVTAERTLVANFEEINYRTITVTADPDGYGTITGGGDYEFNTQATVTAHPAHGYLFVNWTENDVEISTETSITFDVTEDRELVAHFEVDPNPQYSGEGRGTQAEPYIISTVYQLQEFRDIVNGTGVFAEHGNPAACAELGADLNFAQYSPVWTPIGGPGNEYVGTFDGKGHTISSLSNLWVDRSSDYTGLFGILGEGSVVRDLYMRGGDLSGGNYVGALAGVCRGTVTGCSCAAQIYGAEYVGGMFGWCDPQAVIRDSYNGGEIHGGNYVGGIAGCFGGTMENCQNLGVITASADYAGGLAGTCSGTLTYCVNRGSINADNYAGGIVGGCDSGSISNSYNIGAVAANSTAGGIAGKCSGTITIIYCHSSGTVDAAEKQGGIAGSYNSGIRYCYFNTDTAGDIPAVGENGALTSVTGLDGDAFRAQDSFTGFDFNVVWVITSAGPRFRASVIEAATWAAVQSAFDNADGDIVVLLTADITANEQQEALTLPQGKTAELDLNGHTVDRGLTTGKYGGWAVRIDGALTISDSSGNNSGKITGAHSYGEGYFAVRGGGILVKGSLVLNGGTITGNILENPGERSTGGWGGGIYVEYGATCTMNDGVISGNRAIGQDANGRKDLYGGGVCTEGTFTMNGGTISDNYTVGSGGGVWAYGSFTMNGGTISNNTAEGSSGAIYGAQADITMTGGTISGNTSGARGAVVTDYMSFSVSGSATVYGNIGGNVYIWNNWNVINVIGELDPGARIGISRSAPGVVTNGLSGRGSLENFVSDDPERPAALNSGGEVVLPYRITSVGGAHMLYKDGSGAELQIIYPGQEIEEIVYEAEEGYYFPSDYETGPWNGLTLTRDGMSKATISGIPTNDTGLVCGELPYRGKAETPQLVPTQPAAIGEKGSIPTTADMEYRTESMVWTPCEGELTDLDPGVYYIRVAETEGMAASDVQEIEIFGFDSEKEAKPAVTFAATGPDSGVITGLAENAAHVLNGAGLTGLNVTSANGEYEIASGLIEGTLSIVRSGNNVTTGDSDAQTIIIIKAEKPDVEAVQPISAGGRGSIKTSLIHQISSDGLSWTDCTGVSGNLTPGTYYVRTKGSGTALASDATEVVIFDMTLAPVPTAVFTATGPYSGVLTGLERNVPYAIGGAGLADLDIETTTGEYEITEGLTAGDLTIVRDGRAAAELDSEAQTITITKAEIPALEPVQPDRVDGKGSIPTTAEHEFSTDGISWEPCAG